MSEIQKYWESKHVEGDKHMLTGTRLASYRNSFQISEQMLRDKRILEIGVGMGTAVCELVEGI